MLNLISQKKAQLIIVVVFTLLAYVNIFRNEFVIDDKTFIVNWQTKNSFANVGKLLTGDVPAGHEGVYRPIRSLLYAFDWKLFGDKPFGYHLQAILIHLACTVLVYLIVQQLIDVPRRRVTKVTKESKESNALKTSDSSDSSVTSATLKFVPFVAALLFGLHPVHTETITYIASSMESIGLVFFLGSFAAYLNANSMPASQAKRGERITTRIDANRRKLLYLASVVLAGLAYFSTETTLTLPLMIVLYELTIASTARGPVPGFLPSFTKVSEGKPASKDSAAVPLEAKRSGVGNPPSGATPRARSGVNGPTYAKASVGRQLSIARYAPFFALAVLYVAIRFFVIHAGARGPYLANSVYLTFLTMTKVFVLYLKLLVLPINLVNNHIISKGIEAFVYRDARSAAISAQSILDPAILGSLLVLALLVGLGIYFWRRAPVISFCIFWFFITLLPVSEIVPQGSVMNEKFLYLPSVGFCLAAAFALVRIVSGNRFIRLIGLIGLILISFYSRWTVQRNATWHDSVKLWSGDVAVSPNDNAYAYFQLGNAYADSGSVDLAVANYQKSFEINPKFVVALGSIARTYNKAGMVDKAVDFYQKSFQVDPYFWEGHRDLANIYFKQAEFSKAADEYREVLKIIPLGVNTRGEPSAQLIKQSLASLPELKEATRAGSIADDHVWLFYHNILGLSFKMPSRWSLKVKTGEIELSDGRDFVANIITDDKKVNRVLVNNPNSPQISNFDIVLGSVKESR